MLQKVCVTALLLLVGTMSSVDMAGHFGMGVGFSPSVSSALVPMDIAVTKFGLSNKIALEPIVHLHYVMKSNDTKTTDVNSFFELLVDYTFKSHEQTNVYLKAGLGGGTDVPEGAAKSSYLLEVPMGFGLEYFFVRRFSANLSALSAIEFTLNPGNVDGTEISTRLGNYRPSFYFNLFWYY